MYTRKRVYDKTELPYIDLLLVKDQKIFIKYFLNFSLNICVRIEKNQIWKIRVGTTRMNEWINTRLIFNLEVLYATEETLAPKTQKL